MVSIPVTAVRQTYVEYHLLTDPLIGLTPQSGMVAAEAQVVTNRSVKEAIRLMPANATSFVFYATFSVAFNDEGCLVEMRTGQLNRSGRYFVNGRVLATEAMLWELKDVEGYEPGKAVLTRLGVVMEFNPDTDQVVKADPAITAG